MKDRAGVLVVGAALLLLGVALVAAPFGWAVAMAVRESDVLAPLRTELSVTPAGAPAEPVELRFFSLSLTLWSVGTALLIGCLSVAIGWPLAWLIRMRGWGFLALVATPLLLPNYLAFGAFNLLRAPGTALGDWLERSARGEASWIPLLAGKVLAIGSLALWAAPLAAIVLAAWLVRVERATIEQLRVDGATGPRLLLARIQLAFPGLCVSCGLVTLVMLGSAVPLHVARLETLTIRVWLAMDLLPPEKQWRAWIVAWPMVVLAAIGAWWMVRVALASRPEHADVGQDRASGTEGIWWALVVLLAGVGAPAWLFSTHLASAGGLAAFVRTYLDQLVASAEIAAWSGLAGGVILLATWVCVLSAGWPRRAAMVSAWLFACAALVPGVMLGVWIGAFVRRWLPGLEDSAGVLVLAHIARFGIVPILLGWWLAVGEACEQQDQRRLDGATGLGGLVRSAIAANPAAVLAGGLMVAILSFHEIECSIMLQPPGIDTFSRAILNQLHFARTQELSAAGIVLLGVGLTVGTACVWLVGRGDGTGNARNRPSGRGRP